VNLPPVIGIYAPAPQSGKSTIAQHLISHHGYTLLPYAAPLKCLAITFLEQFGISHDTAYDYVHFNKGLIIPEIGLTARHILRSLGTEWGRTCIHPDVWLRAFNQAITQLPPHTLIVVDDVRRYNEAVNLNNIRIQTFPDLIVARMFEFKPSALLEFTEEQKRDVDVGKLFG
jgi:hypothetical protein